VAELSADVVAWIETAAGGKVASSQQIRAGGRRGFFVDVRGDDGKTRELFLQIGRDDTVPMLFHGFDVEAEVLRALEPVGVPVPHVWGTDRDLDVLLVDRVPGGVWFQAPRDPAEAEAIAQDFMVQLARIHNTAAADLDLPSFGPVRSLVAHQADQLDGIARLIERTAPPERIDPLITFSLDWLRSHVPDADGPVVLVQGDTGPGNFLFADAQVTGIIDWELAHFGDPMDDIAWLSWRATQHGFPDFPARLREYEGLTGIAIDDRRVAYYRLNAFGRLGPYFGLADMGAPTRPPSRDRREGEGNATDRSADGSLVIMSMLHRRMRLEATAAAMGTPVPSRDVDGEGAEKSYGHLYDQVLDQLQTMVGRIDDQATAGIGKAIARQVKYLKELDRNGEVFAVQELDDIGRLLGRPTDSVGSVVEARPRLVQAVRDREVTMDEYLDYHWRRLRRDDHLMRFASGVLYQRSWPPLR
jgi:aminoglycoside phosphotransferase (APT) family kinase protein